ncbi:type I-E CRISPR-associated protein Cse2/CasB [Streptomyces roseirectus]|uniref:Type I-E CRISPR-associated protein Cse2/CasB n=1 Tax=Streptomyces roseirectus TaxID=2768066 RepID=A0A7H0IR69_9ACTN|nr:type I-E CRISPR-associated protein Cse2/CasB [Streptomyces roseirectus]QNP75285.1 type I-E CRISPR-associated protein Cse2/CasB [Streptomyces roseirectus]
MPPENSTDERIAARRRRLLEFTGEIEELCRDDPGARTALRTGLRRDLDHVPRMHRFIARWLPRDSSEAEQRAYYAVAAMIAAQPRSRYPDPDDEPGTDPQQETSAEQEPPESAGQESQADGDSPAAERYGASLGRAFALAVYESPERERTMREAAAEARLNLLTRQSLGGLHRHLPASVGYLRELDVPVDWAQLLSDLASWPAYCDRIARRWLQDYYIERNRALSQVADHADQDEATRLSTPA